MSDKPYDQMTHDEILREHAARYAQMTPEEKARLAKEREAAEHDKLSARIRWRNQQLSELTMGDLTDVIGEAMQTSVVPELRAIVAALEEIGEKLDRRGRS